MSKIGNGAGKLYEVHTTGDWFNGVFKMTLAYDKILHKEKETE